MAGFVFRLENVLEHRRTVERQRQRDFAELQREMLRLEQEIAQVKGALNGNAIDLRSGHVDPQLLLSQARYQSAMRHKLVLLRSQIDSTRRELSMAHTALVDAAKQRKILEKLRENQQSQFEQEKHKRAARESGQPSVSRAS